MANDLYWLCDERVDRWFGCLHEVQTVLDAARCWQRLCEIAGCPGASLSQMAAKLVVAPGPCSGQGGCECPEVDDD